MAAAFAGSAAEAADVAGWLQPALAGVVVTAQPDGRARIDSTANEFTVESAVSLPAKGGDAFALEVRTRVGIDNAVHPELACYDAQGREIPPPVPPVAMRQSTTQWQKFTKTFIAWPNTATVRARLRGYGRGTVLTEALAFRATELDTYQTGALMTRPHPRTRAGVLLESNFGIVNRELISTADRDGDGKWALVTVDLDALTAPEQKGDDWRSNFEDNPNVILWTDGAVLKSDSITSDRAPDVSRALHFRTKVHPGPYAVRLGDPGRPVAVSLDGKTWRRAEGGDEIELGTLAMPDGVIEVWIDACYADRIKTGPAYFDYVRLLPTSHAPDIERLFAAARWAAGKPPLPEAAAFQPPMSPVQSARAKSGETKVPITVEAPVFAAARAWPVRCGLPVPQGELVGAENVAVLDASGAKIPSQSRVMATWPDGSVKWLFVDFMHEVSRGAKPSFSVAYGNAVRAVTANQSVRIDRGADGMEVDTGAIRFFVSGRRFGLVENVRLASGQSVQREPIRAEIVESGGRVWRALELPVTKIEVEQAGPLHAVIRVETKLADSGKPAEGFFHRARIHAYAGSPLIAVDYFVANTDSRPAKDVGGSMSSKVAIKSLALKVRPDFAITEAGHALGAGGATGTVVQKSEEDAMVQTGEFAREVRARVAGWVALGARPSPVATRLDATGDGRAPTNPVLHVGVADFREQFPKALRWSPHEVSIDLWAEEGGEFDWIEGVGKTHHLAVYYHAPAAGADLPATAGGSESQIDLLLPQSAALGELLAAGPLLATAAPEWYVRSGAFGDIITATESGRPEIEKNLAAHMRNPVIERVGLGFENYGDHSSGGYVKGSFLWDNNEYDLPAACMVHFARTGDREALRLGLASARHYLDVDTIHYSSQHAEWARAQHVHSHGLFGHHTAQGPDFHHAGYVQGLIWHSYLTGDPAGIEGARGIADWTSRRPAIVTTGMERLVGHALMTCNDVYEATGDEKYLRAAAAFVDQALKWEHPVRSGFLSRIHETPAFYSGSPFCNGVLSAGLLKFNGWAKRPEIDAMLERFARWTLTDCWIAPAALASKGGSPRKGGSPGHIANQGRLMAHVYALTRDPLYLAVPVKLADLGYGANSRPIPGTRSTGLVFNYLPWLLAALREHGDPEPEPQLEMIAPDDALALAPGATAAAIFHVKNTGAEPIENLRVTLHSRLDFTIVAVQPPPARLLPGQNVECRYEVTAPVHINLSCDYNRIAHAHWSALYQRGGRAHLGHAQMKIIVRAPAPKDRAAETRARVVR